MPFIIVPSTYTKTWMVKTYEREWNFRAIPSLVVLDHMTWSCTVSKNTTKNVDNNFFKIDELKIYNSTPKTTR